jgi:hypothetical protein
MRKIYIIIIVCFPFLVNAQSTTQTEYNYMLRGYRQVLENGLDVKVGYKAKVMDTLNIGKFQMDFTELKRDNGTTAGYIVKSIDWDKVTTGDGITYYCIPAISLVNADSYGWSDFYYYVSQMTKQEHEILIKWLSYQNAKCNHK